jgi:hypothetical protein
MMPFTPTHRVPATGMDSWPQADPQVPRGPRIDGGLDVQVLERQGDWTKVVFDNGWSAWVDGRMLASRDVGRASSASRAPRGADCSRRTAAAIIGAGLVALASVAPWLRLGASSNAFDIPLSFLIDYKTTSDGMKVGWLLLAVAAGAVVVALMRLDVRAMRAVGGVAVAIPALFVVQMYRFLDASGGPGLSDVLGIGLVPAVGGGLVIAFAVELGGRR